MVIPAAFATLGSLGFQGAAAGGAAGGSSFLGGLGGLFGASAAGGILGGLFGGGKKTGIGKAEVKAYDIHRRGLGQMEENFARFAPMLFQNVRNVSPGFAALESRALGDLDDTARNARLEQAFMDRLSQQQGARGIARSPSAALQTSLQGLQFGEQMRQQSFDNLMAFQGAFGQPLVAAALGMANPGVSGADFGLQSLALAAGQASARNQSIYGGIQSGLGFALLARGGFFNRQQGA